MRISRIYIKGKNKQKFVKAADLNEDIGIIGNDIPKKDHRQIAIFSEEGRREIEKLETQGLCTKRFQENITIQDLKVQDVVIGDKFTIGEIVLEITELGKKCYNDCPLIKAKSPCPLTKGVIYARVLSGGSINIEDIIIKN